MAMKKIDLQKASLLVGIVALLFAVAMAFTGNTGGIPSLLDKGQKVTCEAQVVNHLGQVNLGNTNCWTTGEECVSLFSLQTQPFGVFSDSGKLLLRTPDDTDVIPYKVAEFDTETHRGTLCTSSTSVEIIILDEDGIQADIETVPVV